MKSRIYGDHKDNVGDLLCGFKRDHSEKLRNTSSNTSTVSEGYHKSISSSPHDIAPRIQFKQECQSVRNNVLPCSNLRQLDPNGGRLTPKPST